MRIHRHDLRDMSLAFGLAFDLKRVTQAAFALCWTLAVVWGVIGVLGWRVADAGFMSAEGMYHAGVVISRLQFTPMTVAIVLCVVAGWWGGFAYLCAPILRSAAVDIALDERGADCNVPVLNRQAAFSPVLAMLLPAGAALCALIWALLALIPGDFGAVLTLLTLPVALLVALIGAIFLLVAVAASPMMGPTAVVEGRDYLEALSRPMSYVMQRPGRYAVCWLGKLGVVTASALAGVATLAVAWGMLAGGLWLVGQGELVTEVAAHATVADEVKQGASLLVLGLAAAVWLSVFMLAAWLMVVSLCADQIIYLLMRYRIDGVTFDKITVPEARLKRFKNAVETEAEAEAARKRFDEQQAEKAAAQ